MTASDEQVLVLVPPVPLRWPLVQSVTWAYEAGDRAQERGRRRGLIRSAVKAAHGKYGAVGGAVRSD